MKYEKQSLKDLKKLLNRRNLELDIKDRYYCIINHQSFKDEPRQRTLDDIIFLQENYKRIEGRYYICE